MRDRPGTLLVVILAAWGTVLLAVAIVVAAVRDDAELPPVDEMPDLSLEALKTIMAKDPDIYNAIGTASAERVSRYRTAQNDDSQLIPGTFVTSQGGGSFSAGVLELVTPPFCEGVRWSGTPDVFTINTPVPFKQLSPGAPADYRRDPVSPTQDCYSSNPPTSGRFAATENGVEVEPGVVINIPPAPGIYDPPVFFPRSAIPYILERAGVFVGYHCADADTACEEVVQRLADVVNQRIDDFDDRVVMARDTDLPVGEIGLAAWTRVLNLRYQDYNEDAAVDFISTHSCRFDPEGFC
jgi:hypothetical protein